MIRALEGRNVFLYPRYAGIIIYDWNCVILGMGNGTLLKIKGPCVQLARVGSFVNEACFGITVF